MVFRVHVTPGADGVADLRRRTPFRARERGRRRLGESPKPRGRASPVETPRAAGSVRTPRPCGRGHDAPWEASRRNGPRSARRRRTSTTQCRRRPRRAREKNVGPDPARLGPDPAVERPRRVAPRGRRGPVPAAPPSRSARGDARSNGREARRGAPRAPQPSCRRRRAAHFRRSPTKSRPRRPLAGRPDELQLDHRKSRCNCLFFCPVRLGDIGAASPATCPHAVGTRPSSSSLPSSLAVSSLPSSSAVSSSVSSSASYCHVLGLVLGDSGRFAGQGQTQIWRISPQWAAPPGTTLCPRLRRAP